MSALDDRVQSPCIRNCCLDESEVCLGCFRSLAEIVRWSDTEDEERRLILERAKIRKSAHAEKYKK